MNDGKTSRYRKRRVNDSIDWPFGCLRVSVRSWSLSLVSKFIINIFIKHVRSGFYIYTNLFFRFVVPSFFNSHLFSPTFYFLLAFPPCSFCLCSPSIPNDHLDHCSSAFSLFPACSQFVCSLL